MKTWLVKLTVDIAAYVEAPSDWHKNTVKTLAREAISFFLSDNDAVTLEIENIVVDDIVEPHEDKG